MGWKRSIIWNIDSLEKCAEVSRHNNNKIALGLLYSPPPPANLKKGTLPPDYKSKTADDSFTRQITSRREL